MTDRVTYMIFDGPLTKPMRIKLLMIRYIERIAAADDKTLVMLDRPMRDDDFAPILELAQSITKKTPEVVIFTPFGDWPETHNVVSMVHDMEPKRKADEPIEKFAKRVRTYMMIFKAVSEFNDKDARR